ncbi:hypothetical protein FRX31_029767 [Thalictrum thalictroides]|uniref:Uncharacterized protein n=1 Tax=Thalictrum thalictroides TaxID=46969 RepID=A0A7J6V6L2_THATH|nr:hypothetical protein FRX31_029767 [Thalictrum thalictroides]
MTDNYSLQQVRPSTSANRHGFIDPSAPCQTNQTTVAIGGVSSVEAPYLPCFTGLSIKNARCLSYERMSNSSPSYVSPPTNVTDETIHLMDSFSSFEVPTWDGIVVSSPPNVKDKTKVELESSSSLTTPTVEGYVDSPVLSTTQPSEQIGFSITTTSPYLEGFGNSIVPMMPSANESAQQNQLNGSWPLFNLDEFVEELCLELDDTLYSSEQFQRIYQEYYEELMGSTVSETSQQLS